LDDNSLLPASFTYEKYFAGKYFGELVRIVFASLYEKALLKDCPSKLNNKDCVTTEDASKISEDILTGKTDKTVTILQRLGCTTDKDVIAILQYIVELLTERTSVLVATPMAFFLERIDRPMTTIAASGSMYKHHPSLREKLIDKIEKMTDKKFKFGLSDDGSGRGAGLVAAIAQRLANKK
jgi:hexokinase